MKNLLLVLLFSLGCADEGRGGDRDLSSGAICRRPTGEPCGYSSFGGCPADDGCNWCDCEFGSFECTLVGCFSDGGTRPTTRCHSHSDCAPKEHCVFDPGCNGEAGRCTGAYDCNGSPGSFCGCDGKTFTSDGPCADAPHSAPGGC